MRKRSTKVSEAQRKVQRLMKEDRPVIREALQSRTKKDAIEYALNMREGYFITMAMLTAAEEER